MDINVQLKTVARETHIYMGKCDGLLCFCKQS